MKVLEVTLLLIFVAFPAPLFAQGGDGTSGGNNTSNTQGETAEFSVSSAFAGVENVSEQGGFIGSGIPSGFVGVDEIYNSNTRTSSSNRRQSATPARPVSRTTPQRRPATQPGVRSNLLGTSNDQFIRSVASIDFNIAIPSPKERLTTLETNLVRLQGIQTSQVSFKDSPTGTTAVLTGTTASERERRVATQLLLLEPGINRVENLLEIR